MSAAIPFTATNRSIVAGIQVALPDGRHAAGAAPFFASPIGSSLAGAELHFGTSSPESLHRGHTERPHS
eukprot:4597019-Prymnesium_polylepis.1